MIRFVSSKRRTNTKLRHIKSAVLSEMTAKNALFLGRSRSVRCNENMANNSITPPETVIERNLSRGFIFLLLNIINRASCFFRFLYGLDGTHLTFENLVGNRCVQTACVEARARDT
jgi:hypothetical protein